MPYFRLHKHTDHTEIFSGYYTSFIKCLEDAVENQINLTHINLKNENLSNANLDSAHMPNANFINTNLTGANLSEAHLTNSIFYNASLYNTCLSYSDLNKSDFRSASFGATLIDGTNIQDCIFSTLSCFDLDFYFTANMTGCLFASEDGQMHKMSKHPIVLKGFMNTHIIILDHSIKIGIKTFPRTILPELMKAIYSYAKSPLTNDNQVFLDSFKETERMA
ncbi:MAG: hypothetical protein COB14_01820 [Alphaproteobacteria bacterium]|nr:MAG: hypothetical protein COB14_01820 [Alphaproteobacteria bacterium]